MAKFRAYCALALLGGGLPGLLGCSGSTPTVQPDAALQAKFAAQHIYLVGRADAAVLSGARVAPIVGLSCRDELIGVHATLDKALEDMQKKLADLQKKPKGKSASAVIDVACYDTSPLVAYALKPYSYGACWPGYFCKGEAVR
jgi:hypothetical protein